MKIAIAVARFNANITEKLLAGALERLVELGVARDNIAIIHVPGAVELPIMAQQFALTKQFNAIICFGAVILGETDHYHYVAKHANDGCLRVALDHNIPVIFGVLTTQNMALAEDRVGGSQGHKGCEAADAAVEMIKAIQQLRKTKVESTVNV